MIFNFLEDSDFIEIRDHLETLKLTDFFATDTRYSASMDDFIMEKIDFRAISKDLATYLKAPKDIENIATKIADRIYKMRCSIVHSNPNFVKESKSDNKGARPFLPTHENLINLDKELILLKQVVKFLISNTSE